MLRYSHSATIDRRLDLCQLGRCRQTRGMPHEKRLDCLISDKHPHELLTCQRPDIEATTIARADQRLVLQDCQCLAHRSAADFQRCRNLFLNQRLARLEQPSEDRFLDCCIRSLAKTWGPP